MAWAPDYITASDLKSYLRITDTDDDAELGFAITAASRAIDRAANRQFGVVGAAEERTYESRWDRRRALYVVEIDDLMTVSGLVITDENGDTISTSDITLEPKKAAAEGRPWTQFTISSVTSEVVVEAIWGWSAVPTAIKQATLIQSSRLFARRNSPYGIAGSPDLGSELRLLAKVDPDVEVAIGPYRRWWAAA
ncbi:MAG: head-tail connector protein [Acidimicrobiales bacterium]